MLLNKLLQLLFKLETTTANPAVKQNVMLVSLTMKMYIQSQLFLILANKHKSKQIFDSDQKLQVPKHRSKHELFKTQKPFRKPSLNCKALSLQFFDINVQVKYAQEHCICPKYYQF